MAVATIESETKFRELIPKLVDAYSMTSQGKESRLLADRANELSPVNHSLSERLKLELMIANFALTTSHGELARSVNECAKILADRQRDVRDFAELICYHAVQIQVKGQTSQQVRAAALESARKPLLKAITQVTKPILPVLTADLIAQPLPVVQTRTSDWAKDACRTIVSQLLASLNVLVEMDVVGIIEWPGETVCKLHFFRHVVTQDQIRSKTTERTRTKTNVDSTRLRTVEQWEQTKGLNVFSIERHEHHVMDAEARKPEEVKFPIPQDQQQFLERIPLWIRKYICVLEGDLILEKVVTTDIRKESFQAKPVRHSVHEETLPAIRPTFEFDPAILLGHFVLSGWTQKEIDKEHHRRLQLPVQPQPSNTDQIRKDGGRDYHALAPYATAGVIASPLMMFFSGLQPNVMVPLSLLMTMVSIALSWKCFSSYCRWQRGVVDVLYVIAGTGTIAFGLLAVQMLLFSGMYGRMSLLPVAFVAGIAAKAVWQIAKSRKPG